jgi:hypothetical protein
MSRWIKSLGFIIASLLLGRVASAKILSTPRFECEVVETLASSTLTARIKGCDEPVVFRIDWLDKQGTSEHFKVSPEKRGAIISSYRLGKTTLTRTIVASAAADCVLVHVVADQPGLVNLSARYVSNFPVKIQDRRELIFTGGKIRAHAWVIPFESDVQPDGDTAISIHGEGEALVLLNFTIAGSASIADTFTRLGAVYDPAHRPPSPSLIWEALKP